MNTCGKENQSTTVLCGNYCLCERLHIWFGGIREHLPHQQYDVDMWGDSVLLVCTDSLLCVDRDFVKRMFRLKGKGKQGAQPEIFTDPLEEVYFQTLVRGS